MTNHAARTTKLGAKLKTGEREQQLATWSKLEQVEVKIKSSGINVGGDIRSAVVKVKDDINRSVRSNAEGKVEGRLWWEEVRYCAAVGCVKAGDRKNNEGPGARRRTRRQS